jgi:hypothetical protein
VCWCQRRFRGAHFDIRDLPATATDPEVDGLRRIVNRFGMEFVEIPAGRFMMGLLPAKPMRHLMSSISPTLFGWGQLKLLGGSTS